MTPRGRVRPAAADGGQHAIGSRRLPFPVILCTWTNARQANDDIHRTSACFLAKLGIVAR